MGRIGLDQDLSTHQASEVGLLRREDLNLKEYRVTIHRLKNAPTNRATTSYTLARSEGDRTPNASVRRATILPRGMTKPPKGSGRSRLPQRKREILYGRVPERYR
jgi:hypothetical protein